MEDRMRKYISSVRWQNAKTYEKTAPHEYTIRDWNPHLADEFAWFRNHIRKTGYTGQYGKTKYRYLNVDGYKYWTMGVAPIINRAVLEQKPVEAAVTE